jgi:hypothetical protein
MNPAIAVLVALLPFAALFAAFLLRMEALEASLCVGARARLACIIAQRAVAAAM